MVDREQTVSRRFNPAHVRQAVAFHWLALRRRQAAGFALRKFYLLVLMTQRWLSLVAIFLVIIAIVAARTPTSVVRLHKTTYAPTRLRALGGYRPALGSDSC